ncbi:unnamed protein product [Prorocentrum cordatum]|uniref:Uncharacterized protein n=1 Tax=Prorocentrum cordatum TaxID=2364126 RepID=A0ABN9VRF6_9DINO|nr:unnamed protein product [Polarella glacialis]
MVSGETAVAKCRGRSYARPRKRSPMERGGRRCQKQSLGHRPPRTANFGEAEGRERSLSSNRRAWEEVGEEQEGVGGVEPAEAA